jgi:putative transposase
MARVVVPGAPHHVTQRGNRRQQTFFNDGDYIRYREIAAEAFAAAGVEIWAYCLMPNHVHLIACPGTREGLAEAVGLTHRRYTGEINRRERWSGYLWQGRFASFVMDDEYLRACVRYVGLNPVRAGLTARAADWPWSSVRAHVTDADDPLLGGPPVMERFRDDRAAFFDCDIDEEGRKALRRASQTGRPLGAADWVKALERASGQALATPRRGRPPVEMRQAA